MELLEIINELTTNSIINSTKFYSKYFGFKIIETEGNPITWAKLQKDNCTIMIEDYNKVKKEIKTFPQKTSTSNLIKFKIVTKEQLLVLYNTFKKDNIKLFIELKETSYNSLEFGVVDPDNNLIIISSNNI